jgi:hypothetical protein
VEQLRTGAPGVSGQTQRLDMGVGSQEKEVPSFEKTCVHGADFMLSSLIIAACLKI